MVFSILTYTYILKRLICIYVKLRLPWYHLMKYIAAICLYYFPDG